MSSRPKSPINIEPDILRMLREMQQVVNKEQMIINSIQLGMSNLLKERYHVNLLKEHWSLDLDAGVLTKEEDDPPTPTRKQ